MAQNLVCCFFASVLLFLLPTNNKQKYPLQIGFNTQKIYASGAPWCRCQIPPILSHDKWWRQGKAPYIYNKPIQSVERTTAVGLPPPPWNLKWCQEVLASFFVFDAYWVWRWEDFSASARLISVQWHSYLSACADVVSRCRHRQPFVWSLRWRVVGAAGNGRQSHEQKPLSRYTTEYSEWVMLCSICLQPITKLDCCAIRRCNWISLFQSSSGFLPDLRVQSFHDIY